MNTKICFISQFKNLNRGSYRIWVNDLNIYFKQLGISSSIVNNITNEDVIIVDKEDVNKAANIKKQFPKKKIGLINPVVGSYDFADFIITGSIEEQLSLSNNKNVFLFPLIESLYQGISTKKHKHTNVLRFCYHGHYPHLAKFGPHLKAALEDFSKEINIELLIINGNPDFNWKIGRPNINIIFKKWNINRIIDDIMSADIGLCPNITYLKEYKCNNNIDFGLYSTDYAIRFKNKSNAGRCFVFHQLGIPVVADLTPSNLHILGNPDNGFIASKKESWINSFKQLSSHKTRNFISNNAKKEFDRLYNPLDWAKQLYKKINEI